MSRSLLLAVPVAAAAAALIPSAPAAGAGPWDRLLPPAGTCEPQSARSASVRARERAMRCMITFARQRQGVPPLQRTRVLMHAADRKAADILGCNEFSHTACGRPFTFHMQAGGYAEGCHGAGENIAWGSGSLGGVRSIMRGWLNSDGHRANLLNARYRDHGVGLRTGRMGGRAGASVWVHQLGFRC